ncbi:MAG: acyl carrier protein [Ruminococcus sp.]|jgi:acyl carrier protein|nr:acyl carrier protein [Ruminococcus sp.]
METIDKVKAILSERLDTPTDEILDSSSVQDDLGADSLDIVDIIMDVEESFDIQVPEEDIPTLKTVEDIAKYVDSKK